MRFGVSGLALRGSLGIVRSGWNWAGYGEAVEPS